MASKYTIEERVEMVLLYGDNHNSLRDVANIFHFRHPDRPKPSPNAISETVTRFKETGNVNDKARSGRPKTSLSEDKIIDVLAMFTRSPVKSVRKGAAEAGISKSSVYQILKKHKWHPFKVHLIQELNDDDFDRRLQFCTWAQEHIDNDEHFGKNIIFSDEAIFFLNGTVNRHNCRYWAESNPRWSTEGHTQRPQKVVVWCGLWDTKILGPYFFLDQVTCDSYLNMLQDNVFPPIEDEVRNASPLFQQDGAAPHFAVRVRNFLDQVFPERWIGRRGPIEWPPRSPDLTPLDFFLWGYLKSVVFNTRPRTLGDLQEEIVAACRAIPALTCANVLREWRSRIGHCIVSGGHQFEHLL
jgi:transposase